MNETLPSDKLYVIVCKDRTRIFLDEAEYKLVSSMLLSGNVPEFFKVGESIVSKWEIGKVIPTAEYNEGEKSRQGYWKCNYGHWHSKNEECGHGTEDMYNKMNNKNKPL